MTTQQLTTQQLDVPTPTESPAIREAIEIIDGALSQMFQRELVSSSEVTNLLLDVRSMLAAKN